MPTPEQARHLVRGPEHQRSAHLYLKKMPGDNGILIKTAENIVRLNIFHSQTSLADITIRQHDGIPVMFIPSGRLQFLRKAFLLSEDYRRRFFDTLDAALKRADEVVITRTPRVHREVNEIVTKETAKEPLPEPVPAPPPPKPLYRREIEEILGVAVEGLRD